MEHVIKEAKPLLVDMIAKEVKAYAGHRWYMINHRVLIQEYWSDKLS